MQGKSYNQVGSVQADLEPDMEYTLAEAKVLATIMCQMNKRVVKTNTITHGTQHVVTYSLKKGTQQFGDRGKQATLKEMKQFHDRECFTRIHRASLNPTKCKRVLESF